MRKNAEANHFLYFNATPALKQQFGSKPETFYGHDDMHFSFEGLEKYSTAVAGFMASSMIKPKD